jgi:Cu2+-exporting ATPase
VGADGGAAAVVDDPVELERFTRWVDGPGGERLAESSLQLSGLYCAACAGTIEAALAAVPGVQRVQVGGAAQRATVCWDPARTQASALLAAVRAAGYGAVPDAAAPARLARRAEHRQALWRLFVAGFCSMQVMMLAWPSYVAGPGELPEDLAQLLNWGAWLLTLPVLVFAAAPFFSSAWHSLRARRIGMDVPVSLALVITFVASTGATFSPGGLFGHEVWFDSVTMFVAFLLGARYLALRARHRAAVELEATLNGMPEVAWRETADGAVESVSVQRLAPGDVLRVPVGQAFAADGVLIEGSTRADEALLSGESAPVDKTLGATLVAGSINLGAPVRMRVERVGADTRLEAIVAMMRSALVQRPASAALADRWAGPFLWAVLLLAAGAAAVWSFIDPARAVWVAVAVLIVTCPCALSIAAPATLVAAARGLARQGVLLQRLDALEVLAQVRHIYFDKTGTLSEARLRTVLPAAVSQAGQALAVDPATLPAIAASLAGWSSHPVAAALRAATTPATCAWQDVHELPGQGLRAQDDQGRTWRLGALTFVAGPEAAQAQPGPAAAAGVWLGCEGRVLAGFELADEPRAGAREAVQALRGQGLQVHLLSGDTPARAQALGETLGVNQVVAGASPEHKLAVVAAAQARGERVAMVGDGINDAPVLARADVSLAMGQGALVARSSADAVLVSNRPGDIVLALARARRTMGLVRQNLIWAASYNAVAIPLALVGWMPPWAAGLGMAGSSLLVMLNALRAAR